MKLAKGRADETVRIANRIVEVWNCILMIGGEVFAREGSGRRICLFLFLASTGIVIRDMVDLLDAREITSYLVQFRVFRFPTKKALRATDVCHRLLILEILILSKTHVSSSLPLANFTPNNIPATASSSEIKKRG